MNNPPGILTGMEAPVLSLEDPYPWYLWMQEHQPAFRLGDGGWIITRYETAEALLNDSRCAHWGQDPDAYPSLPPLERAIAQTLHALAPGQDPAYRRQIMHQLAAASVQLEEQAMVAQADSILQSLRGCVQIEFMRHFAHPFTFGTIARMLGLSADDAAAFSALVSRMEGGYLGLILEPARSGNGNPLAKQFIATLCRLLESKRRSPGNDLCSAILAIAPPGKMDESFTLSLLTLLLYAGHENMMNFLGNSLLALVGKRDEHLMLGRSLPCALQSVDELIRYDSPLQYILLRTREAMGVHGELIPAGSRLMICVGAANRDPRAYENAGQLDLNRRPRHLGFGVGAFRCVGARLAQLQGAVGLHRFFAGIRSYQPGRVVWGRMPVQRGPSELNLEVEWGCQ